MPSTNTLDIAIAPAAGDLFGKTAVLPRGLPVLMLVGDADPMAPWEGGEVSYVWGDRKDHKDPFRLNPERWATMNACREKTPKEPDCASSRPPHTSEKNADAR